MGRGTSRKSISVRTTTDVRIKRFTSERDQSRSSFVEDLVATNLGPATPDDQESYERDRAKKPKTGPAPEPQGTPEKPPKDDGLKDYIPPIQSW